MRLSHLRCFLSPPRFSAWAVTLLLGFAGLGLAQRRPPDPGDGVVNAYSALWRRGAVEEAFALVDGEIDRATEGVPIVWLMDRTHLLFQLGRVDEAISDMEWLQYRRPSPVKALHLANLYQYRGKRGAARRVLREAVERFKGPERYLDDVDDMLAMIRILELRGENPKNLLRTILDGDPDKPEALAKRYMAAANLAFRKFDFQLAGDYYQRVLDIHEDHQEALAGLAECFWRSGDSRVTNALDAVIAQNPFHFRACAIQTEMALDGGEAEEALTLIDKILHINPNHIRFLGLKAGAMFLLDRLDEMRAAQEKALQVNRHASEVYRITGRIASRHYRFEEGAAFQRQALELEEDDHLARAFYGFDLLRLGRDEEGRAELTRSFEADRFNVQVYNMLELLDTLAEFQVVDRGSFRLKMPAREYAIWGGEALALVEEAHRFLQGAYQLQLEKPIHVQIFDQHDDFMVRSVGLPGNVGHLGICFGRLVTMDSPSAREKWAMNWRSVLWHELAHVATLQKTRNRIPRWLSEGISVYEETRKDPSWGQRLDPQYRMVLAQNGQPGLKSLETYFTRPRSQLHLMFGYFLAGEFVRFYVERHGFDALLASLDGIAANQKALDALVAATGAGTDGLAREFQAFLTNRFQPFENLPKVRPQALLEGLDPQLTAPPPAPLDESSAFGDAMLAGGKAFKEGRLSEAEEAWQKAYKLYPEYMGADGPLFRLLELYRQRESRREVVQTLHRILELDATQFQACLQLAEHYREEGDWERVLEISDRALAVDPFDVDAVELRFRALSELGRGPGALAGIERLMLLNPNRQIDYKLMRIDLLAKTGDRSAARLETLQLLEEVPHSWEAQRRLLRFVDGSEGQ